MFHRGLQRLGRGLLLLVAACAFSLAVTPPARAELSDAVALIKVYMVDATNAQRVLVTLGSGFLMDAQGHIVTARHVVDATTNVVGKREFEVYLISAAVGYYAEKVGDCGSGYVDVCILKMDSNDVRASGVSEFFKPACRLPGNSEAIVALGMLPEENRMFLRNPSGIIDGLTIEDKYTSSVNISPGMSGGPVLGQDGMVIAVNKGVLKDSGSGGLLMVALVQPLRYARSMIEDRGVICPLDVAPPPVETDDDTAATLGTAATFELEDQPDEIVTIPMSTPEGLTFSGDHFCSPIATSFKEIIGPDTEPVEYGFSHVVHASDGCELSTVRYIKRGDATLDSFEIVWNGDRRSAAINYDLTSSPETTRWREFAMSFEQQPQVFVSASVDMDADFDLDDSSIFNSTQLGSSTSDILLHGDHNYANILQNGDFHDATVTQSGDDNVAGVGPFAGPCVGADCFVGLQAEIVPTSAGPAICGTIDITIDRALIPTGDQPEWREYQEQLTADEGCRLYDLTFDIQSDVPEPLVNWDPLPSDVSGILTYGFGTRDTKPAHLKIAISIKQAPLLDVVPVSDDDDSAGVNIN